MFEGKAALVTGSARGVGATIARRLVEAGATVMITDILEEEGRATAADLGDGALFTRLDVTVENDWRRAVEQLVDRCGRLDILVNNAAILHMGSFENTDADTFRRVLDVNITGPFLGIRTVIEPMTNSGGGSIVNIGSVDGLVPLNGMNAYVASKWGLRGLTKAAALDLGRAGIRVNCVCPTGGNIAMQERWISRIPEYQPELGSYGNSRGIPRSAELDEIADATLFLASEQSRFISGIDLPVDGAHTAGNYLDGFATF
jgi:3alpha(or 20beta)-hydroxysteroid dehydrogenase